MASTIVIPKTHKRFYEGAEKVVQRKKEELRRRKRCLTCWHPKHLYCVCNHTPHLQYKMGNVKFIVYMHYLEYANAGDDAKLLMCCSPERTSLYLHGVEQDDVNMKMEIESFKSKSLEHKYAVVLLFPGPNSVTIDTFLEQRAALMNNHNDKATYSSDKLNVQSPLLVIVMDATWRRARRMANHFRKYIDASVPHIQLRPTTASIYARTQSQDGRICTIEALALLLKEYGEDENICDSLINYVRLNNRALKCEFKNTNQILWEYQNNLSAGSGGHPAWYFGRVLVQEHSNTRTIVEEDEYGNEKIKTIKAPSISVDNIIDAARLGLVDKVRHFLTINTNNGNAIVDSANKYQWTALHKASFKGYLDIVRLLINHKGNINLQTSDGNTALMLASWKGKLNVVKELLDNDADHELRNGKGKTARMVAEDKRHKHCIDAIDQYILNAASSNVLPSKRKKGDA